MNQMCLPLPCWESEHWLLARPKDSSDTRLEANDEGTYGKMHHHTQTAAQMDIHRMRQPSLKCYKARPAMKEDRDRQLYTSEMSIMYNCCCIRIFTSITESALTAKKLDHTRRHHKGYKDSKHYRSKDKHYGTIHFIPPLLGHA